MSASKSSVEKLKDEFRKPSSIHNLIENSLDAHIKDIKLYTTGHLNFNRFTKPSDSKSQYNLKWKSRFKKQQRESSNPEVTDGKKLQMMSDALFDFSLGSSGVIPVNKSLSSDPTFISPIHPSQSQKDMEDTVMKKLEKQIKKKDISLKFSENESQPASKLTPSPLVTGKKVLSYMKPQPTTRVCVEELKLPELMLSPLNSVEDLPPSLRAKRESSNQYERKKFITTHLAGITCKDQFHKMVDFDENILQKSELLDRNVYDGHNAVAHLENKLVGKLLMLQMKNLPAGPSFERLQVYSEVWGDLVLDSSIFGSVLEEIKREYDNYLSHLLEMVKYSDRDEIVHSYRVIDDDITSSRLRKAEEVFQEVDDLEIACRDALLKNYTLRGDIEDLFRRIEEEKRMKEEEKRETTKRLLPHRRKGLYASSLAASAAARFSKGVKITKEASIKAYRAEIWKQIDRIVEIKRELKENFVPKTLHRNVIHSMKDTEIELQRFYSQEAYLTQHIKDTTDLLDHAFAVGRLSEEEQKTIWELITNDSPSLSV